MTGCSPAVQVESGGCFRSRACEAAVGGAIGEGEVVGVFTMNDCGQ